MGLKGRLKGFLGNIKKKFYGDIARSTGEIQKDFRRDFTGQDPAVQSYKVRAQGYLPPPLDRRETIIPTSLRPFTDKVTYDKFNNRYRDNVTKQFVSRNDYMNRLSDHKTETLLVHVARKRPELDSEEIGGLVEALMNRRNEINDIARDQEERLRLLKEDEDYNDLKDLLGILSP